MLLTTKSISYDNAHVNDPIKSHSCLGPNPASHLQGLKLICFTESILNSVLYNALSLNRSLGFAHTRFSFLLCLNFWFCFGISSTFSTSQTSRCLPYAGFLSLLLKKKTMHDIYTIPHITL